MADLTILVPSRQRPKSAVQLYEAFRETCTADTKLVIVVDSNDPTLSTYYTLLNGFGQVVLVEPGRRGMVAALQNGLENFADHLGYAVGFMGDDHRPRTVGWDTRYLEALRDMGTGFVYGDDLYQGEAIPTQVAMTTDIYRTLGYICPPTFDHLCVDVVWKDWGQAIDRLRYLDDVVVEHMHYLAGTTQKDEGYFAVNSAAIANHDSEAYQVYKSEGAFESDVAKLKTLLSYNEFVDGGTVQEADEVSDEPYEAVAAKKRGRPRKAAEVDD